VTFAKLLSQGSGRLRYRLEVEGWPESFVTDASITNANSSAGRTMLAGLSYRGLEISDRIIPLEGKVQANGITFRVTPTCGRATSADGTTSTDPITDSLSRYPDPVATLGSAGLDASGTTIDATPALSNNTTYHVGTEAIRVGTYPTVTRAYWGTIAQEHRPNAIDGASVVYVYDRPPTMEGRICALFAYGDGDDVAGEGTQVWTGVVSRQPRIDSDGVTWMIEALPLTHLLKQHVAGHASVMKPQGLYLSWLSPMWVRVVYEADADEELITGLYTEETLAAAVVQAISDGLTATGADAHFSSPTFSLFGSEWRVGIRKDTGDSVRFGIQIGSEITGRANPLHPENPGWVWDVTGTELISGADEFVLPATYSLPLTWPDTMYRDGKRPTDVTYQSAVASVLGATGGILEPGSEGTIDWGSAATAPANRIHVNVDTSFFTDLVAVEIPGTNAKGAVFAGGANAEIYQVTDYGTDSITTSAGDTVSVCWIEVETEALIQARGHFGFCGVIGPDTEIKAVRMYATGTVFDFMQSLEDNSIYANLGDVPWIPAGVMPSAARLLDGSGLPAFALIRQYAFTSSLSVESILVEEMKLIVHTMYLTTSGVIGVRPLQVPTLARSTAVIDPSVILAPPTGEWPRFEPQRDGVVSSVSVQQNYNATTGDWTDPPIIFRDADAVATHKNKGRGAVAIKPYSTPTQPADLTEVAEIAGRFLAFASREYIVITVQVPFTLFTVACGDVVTLTHKLIPDGAGGRGVVDRACMVIERKWNLDPAGARQGTLVLWMPARGETGYAPSGVVTGEVDNGDDSWTYTLDPSNGTNEEIGPDSSGSGDVASTFAVGDKIQIIDIGSAVDNSVDGEITAISGNDVTVQLDGPPFTPTLGMALIYERNDGNDAQASQRIYAYVADSNFALANGDFARRFA